MDREMIKAHLDVSCDAFDKLHPGAQHPVGNWLIYMIYSLGEAHALVTSGKSSQSLHSIVDVIRFGMKCLEQHDLLENREEIPSVSIDEMKQALRTIIS